MIALAAIALRLAAAALPLLLSAKGALPSLPVERLSDGADAALHMVLDLVATAAPRLDTAWSDDSTVLRTARTARTVDADSESISGGGAASTLAAATPISTTTSTSTTGSTAGTSGTTGDDGGTGKAASPAKRPGAAAGAGLVPAADTTGTSTATHKGHKSAGATGASGATGATGATSSTSTITTSSSDDETDNDDSDRDRGGDEEDQEKPAGDRPPATRRSSTPDLSFGLTPVHVPAGEYHRGDIVCIGGNVEIDGEVHGDVTVVGGVLTVSGLIKGNVVAVGSRVHLNSGAYLRRGLVCIAGPVDRAPDARIGGEFHSIDLPNFGRFASGHGAVLYLLSVFLWVAVIATAFRFMAVLVVAAIAPWRVEGALATPRPSWILAFFLGFVVHIVAGIVGLLLVAACITSPIGVALWLSVRVAVWMGLASIYLEVGRNLSKAAFGSRLSYFGSILLGFAIFAIVGVIPVIGWFIGAIVSCIALGLMLLTRFGGRQPRALATGALPPIAPAAQPLAPSGTA